MISGPRVGRPTGMRRWFASMLARELDAFVVPGIEMLNAFGLDPAGAGLRVVANPRHASVLLLVGDIPPRLAPAAAVAYAQQPRPRAILTVGASSPGRLPAADVSVVASQAAFVAGVAELRRRIAAGAWAPDPPAFEIREAEDAGPGPAIGEGHGTRHASMEHAASAETGQHDEMVEMDHGHTAGMHHGDTAGADHGQMAGMDHGDMAGMDHGDMAGVGHGDMAGMDHGHMGAGFMSMEMVTRDLPRSADGLPMEWLEVPFGPLFAGLPGGLSLVLTLDGDTVARAVVRGGVLQRDLEHVWPGPANGFADRLAAIDPLARCAYRALAWRALEQVAGISASWDETCRRIAALEAERAASHLAWFARFGFLVGDVWLADRASSLARTVRVAHDPRRVAELRTDIAAFVAKVRRTPLLKRRLAGVGYIEPAYADGLVGPVARASGRGVDARAEDPNYVRLGFAPVIEQGGDALARLTVRLAEIEQSLGLIQAARAVAPWTDRHLADIAGVGTARVETPRGVASLRVTLDAGNVVEAALETPSSAHVHLVEHVAINRELSDALLGVVSIDLSPWELDR